MGSKRVPGKVLAPIQGRPLIEYVVQSLQQSEAVGRLIIATSNLPCDNAIADYCDLNNVICYRGSEQNVAERFFELAQRYDWEAFFRVSADSPLLDHRLLDQAAELFDQQPCDFVTNIFPRTFPRGQSIELLRAKTFIESYPHFNDAEDLEHVTRFFYRNCDDYSIRNLRASMDWSHVHMAVDTPEDLRIAKKVLTNMRQSHTMFSLQQKVNLWVEGKDRMRSKVA